MNKSFILFFILVVVIYFLFFRKKEENYFYYEEIPDDIKQKMEGVSFVSNEVIHLEDLVYVHVLHVGFDSLVHRGVMIVNRDIAEDVVAIFRELYIENYPIERMELIDVYQGDDKLSMLNNNTSCFNYRVISGTDRLSNHALGRAIDINPLYNPYVGERDGQVFIEPIEGSKYVDRTLGLEVMIEKDDTCYRIFQKYGFSWGGDWEGIKDYQHFEKIED